MKPTRRWYQFSIKNQGAKWKSMTNMTLGVLQPKIKAIPNLQHINKPYRIIQAFNNLVVKNKDGREVDLKRGGLNNFLLLKKTRAY